MGYLTFEVRLCVANLKKKGSVDFFKECVSGSVACERMNQDGWQKIDDWLDLKKFPALSEWKLTYTFPEDTICSFISPCEIYSLTMSVRQVGAVRYRNLTASEYLD